MCDYPTQQQQQDGGGGGGGSHTRSSVAAVEVDDDYPRNTIETRDNPGMSQSYKLIGAVGTAIDGNRRSKLST